MKFAFTALLVAMLSMPAVTEAHKQSDSYLKLVLGSSSVVHGQWDIALRDLDFAIGLDANADDAITWSEVKAQQRAIQDYALQRLQLESTHAAVSGNCPIEPQALLVDRHVDGAYAVLRFEATCAATPERLSVHYGLLFALDPNHRGLLDVRTARDSRTAVLSAANPSIALDMRITNSRQQLRSFVREGISHIWQGYDHILFLFTLLLPAVVTHRSGAWQARGSVRDSAVDVLKVVTAFTAAHSVTLSLAALGIVRLSTRFVETAIALTVLLGALNILYPVIRERRWLVALVFGLIHGLGFASVLADLDLRSHSLVLALLGFNVGVELGQLAIVAALMPLVYLLRTTVLYRKVALPAGAATIGCLAIYWMGERLTS